MHRILLAFAAIAATAGAQPLRPAYGLLHAHTAFSDGSGTPEEAYQRAKSHGLQFFGITSHNHAEAESGAKDRIDGILIATTPALYDGTGLVSITRNGRTENVKSLRRAANDATGATFVALYGQEFSTISSGNHVNVIGAPSVLRVANGDFQQLYQDVAASSETMIVQFNHPDVHKDLFYKGRDPKVKRQMQNDYGIDDFGKDFKDLVAGSGGVVRLIEVLSGPAMVKTRPASFRYRDNEDDYYYYLCQGFHLSPSVGHDNHYPTWGDSTDARMGVYPARLTQTALLAAFANNRTFATEDKDLAVMLKINNQELGSTLRLAEDAELTIAVTIEDRSEPTAKYQVDLVYGLVDPQDATNFVELRSKDGVVETLEDVAGGPATFDGYVASGKAEFFYVVVTQDDGDRLWTAPIWINHDRTARMVSTDFVWSSRSAAQVFHNSWCVAARNISPQNRKTGASGPAGWTQHACRRPVDDDH